MIRITKNDYPEYSDNSNYSKVYIKIDNNICGNDYRGFVMYSKGYDGYKYETLLNSYEFTRGTNSKEFTIYCKKKEI